MVVVVCLLVLVVIVVLGVWRYRVSGTYYKKGGKDRVSRESTRSTQAMIYTKRADSVAIGNLQALEEEAAGGGYAAVSAAAKPPTVQPAVTVKEKNPDDKSGAEAVLQTSV